MPRHSLLVGNLVFVSLKISTSLFSSSFHLSDLIRIPGPAIQNPLAMLPLQANGPENGALRTERFEKLRCFELGRRKHRIMSYLKSEASFAVSPKDPSALPTFTDKRPPQGSCKIKTFCRGLEWKRCGDICTEDKTKGGRGIEFISRASETLIFCRVFEKKAELNPTLGTDLFGVLI